MPLWCFLYAIPFQCSFCSCMGNYLLLILPQNQLDITQDVNIHHWVILMSRAPLHELKGFWDCLFQQWVHAPSLVCSKYSPCNIWFLAFSNFARPFRTLFDLFDTLPCNLRRKRALQKITLRGCWNEFFNFMILVG
jgi:hypothetical protein